MFEQLLAITSQKTVYLRLLVCVKD